jgi:hypothetical protein
VLLSTNLSASRAARTTWWSAQRDRSQAKGEGERLSALPRTNNKDTRSHRAVHERRIPREMFSVVFLQKPQACLTNWTTPCYRHNCRRNTTDIESPWQIQAEWGRPPHSPPTAAGVKTAVGG